MSEPAPARLSQVTVAHSQPQGRLDLYLRDEFPAVSRGTFQRLIAEGWVTINGRPCKTTHAPQAGERVEIRWPDARPAEARPEAMPLNVIFEDACLLVLDKPPALVVHPAAGHDEHTLVNALLHHCAGQLSGIGGVARPGIVHRLDKDTSGCLVVAKTDAAHLALSAQFASRVVRKAYHAILCGTLARAAGEIQAAIARHPSHRKRMAVTAGPGRAAHTSYRVLQHLREATLVEAALHTGRTHQLRVHFHHLGHPIVGDDTYGQRANLRLREATGYAPSRQMLHASRLAFRHPSTGVEMEFEAPWPADFRDALTALREET
jgi:23S rRNA pseudouridine1911/1915/1917 synthase